MTQLLLPEAPISVAFVKKVYIILSLSNRVNNSIRNLIPLHQKVLHVVITTQSYPDSYVQ